MSQQIEFRIDEATAGTHVDAELLEFLGPVAERQDVGGPSLADDVENRHVLGEPDRVVERKEQDQAQGQALGARSDGGGQEERRREVAVVGGVVLAHDGGKTAVVLGPRAHVGGGGVQLDGRCTDGRCAHVEAEHVHDASST